MKRCSKCKQLLSLDCFYKNKNNKDGLNYFCKDCDSERGKKQYQKHKERIRERYNQYYLKNKKKINEKRRKDHPRHKKEKNEYRQKHRIEINEKLRQYYQKNKKKHAVYMKQYRWEHKKEKNERENRRYKKNIAFRLHVNMKNAIGESLRKRNISKNGRSWESLVDFTLEELMIHLKSLFQPKMNWKNRSKWHIDHIKPASLFEFQGTNDPEFKKCWSLDNLQPLWAEDNLRKNNKYQISS